METPMSDNDGEQMVVVYILERFMPKLVALAP
jgi:hypothetical protein